MKRSLLALILTIALAACAVQSQAETYSIGSSEEILSFEQARTALTGEVAPPDAAAVKLDQSLRIVKAVPPSYPLKAKRAEIEGTVLLEITVDERGKVVRTVVVGEPHKLLADAAISAVSQWEFQPHTMGGLPVKVRLRAPVTFKLDPPRDASVSQ